MARPCKCRSVSKAPLTEGFAPIGVSMGPEIGPEMGTVELGLDELEALCLADFQGLYQDDASACMGISRATFGRLLEGARHKVADALTNGKTLRFKGGMVRMLNHENYLCEDCGGRFYAARDSAPPRECPHCHGSNYKQCPEDGKPSKVQAVEVGSRRRRKHRA